MPDKTAHESPDSDPSFIRTDASDLFNWARRLGMSSDQVREALDQGLIKPAAGASPLLALKPVAVDVELPQERPDA